MEPTTNFHRIAAKYIGISPEEYISQREKGLKWCGDCRQWHPATSTYFTVNNHRSDQLDSICRKGRSRRRQKRRVQAIAPSQPQPEVAPTVTREAVVVKVPKWLCAADGRPKIF